MKEKHIVLAGFGPENVLEGLYLALKKEKYDVTLIDFQTTLDEKIENLKALQKIVFVTSQHISIDSKSYRSFYPQAKHYVDPISLINILNPSYNIYVNHDNLEPFEESDLRYSDYFDIFLIHSKCKIPVKIADKYLDLGDVKSLGKKIDYDLKFYLDSYGVFLLNEPEKFMDNLVNSNLLEIEKLCKFLRYSNIPVKIHNDEAYSMIEEYFTSNEVRIIDRTISVYNLIEASCMVIGNGEGSIFEEAKCQNKPLFWYDLDLGQNREKEIRMRNNYSLPIIDLDSYDSLRKSNKSINRLQCIFDFEKFLKLINELDSPEKIS